MNRNLNVRVATDTFEPALFSDAELHWLSDHLTTPPISAFLDPLPPLVNRAAVEPALTRMYELAELERHRKIAWAGIGAIRDSIERYLLWQERAMEIRRRTKNRITNPSMFHWDETGKPTKYAIGADSGQLVRSEILDDGSRRPFGVLLTGRPEDVLRQSIADMAPWVKTPQNPALQNDEIRNTEKGPNGLFTCSICDHVVPYKVGSAAVKQMARARMGQHLKRAAVDVNRHRMLYSKTFR